MSGVSLADGVVASPPGTSGGVDSVNGQTGDVVLDAADVGALDQTSGDVRYVLKAGDTMTGALSLPAGTPSGGTLNFGIAANSLFAATTTSIGVSIGSTERVRFQGTRVNFQAALEIGWASTLAGALDVKLNRSALNALTVDATAGTTFTGPVALPTGLSTAPSVLIGVGAGLYQSTGNQLNFSLNNLNVYTINSTGFQPTSNANRQLGASTTAWSNVYAASYRTIEAANGKQGTATLVLGTVTVANTSVTANSRIFLTTQSLGTVSVPSALAVSARVPGTSFTILASALTDTSTVAYEIFEPA